jgi:hypothetical protein
MEYDRAAMVLRATPEQLREFLARDRGLVTEWDREHWREQLRRGGPIALAELGDAMWRDLRAIDPSWPTAEARHADFEHHVRLKARIDAAATAFTARARTR